MALMLTATAALASQATHLAATAARRYARARFGEGIDELSAQPRAFAAL